MAEDRRERGETNAQSDPEGMGLSWGSTCDLAGSELGRERLPMLLECDTVDRQNAAARVAASGALVALTTPVFPGCAPSLHGGPGLSIALWERCGIQPARR